MSRILTRFPSLHGKELSLKYADTLNDWIELPADDLDSFVDMIETAKDSARGNLITIELKVCELAQTLQQTEQKRLPFRHRQTTRECRGACMWLKINQHDALMKSSLVV